MTSDSYLTIGTVVCNQDAFRAKDLLPLMGETSRGSNRILPRAVGQRGLRRTRDQIDEAITWYVDGRRDPGGTVYASPASGLIQNLNYYRNAFFDQANASTGLVGGTLTLANGTVTANIQVWDWDQVWTGPMSATVVTRIVVPAGEWT